MLRQRGAWRSRSSLREVTTTEQLLEQALGQVAAATRATLELAENDGTGQLIFTARQCLDVQNLLVGRLNMARSQATEQVLAEQVYSLDPEYDQVDQTDLSETTQIQLEQINTMMRELHNQD